MNESDTLACEEIFKQLLQIPISRIFWERMPEFQSQNQQFPYFLSMISLKLNKNMYKSPEHFFKEVTTLFETFIQEGKSENLIEIGAKILQREFNRILSENPISHSPTAVLANAIDSYSQECLTFLKEENENEKNKTPEKKQENKEISAEFFKKDPNTFTADDLSHLISIVNDPEIIISIAKLSKQLQPETITLGEIDLTFHFCLMTEETIHKLAEFAFQEIKNHI